MIYEKRYDYLNPPEKTSEVWAYVVMGLLGLFLAYVAVGGF